MKNFIQKYWRVAIGILLSLTLIGFLAYASIKNKNVSESSTQKSYRLTVALVNEDKGGTFHNTNYNFGTNFVNLVTQDQNNNWTVTSRDIAESGLRHKVYEMVVIIPHNFTERTLQLENSNPRKAQIQYELNTSKNPIIRTLAEQKVASILQLFNRRVVNMYFSSIVNNLHNAQTNVEDMVDKSGYLNNDLLLNVNKPFQGLNDNFSSINDQGKLIQDNYNNFKDQSKQFTDEAKDAMDQTVSNGNDSLSGLKDFNKSQGQQMTENKKTVSSFYNDSVKSEKDLLNQSHEKMVTNDKEAKDQYKSQYDGFKEQIGGIKTDDIDLLNSFNDVTGGEIDKNIALKSLIDSNNDLKPHIDALQEEYDKATDVMKQEKDQLTEDQSNMHEFFTGSKEGKLNRKDIKSHLKENIQKNIDTNPHSDDLPINKEGKMAIESYINRNVVNVPTGINQAIEWMQFVGGISESQSEAYIHDASLAAKYAKENNLKQKDSSDLDSIKNIISSNIGTSSDYGFDFTFPIMKSGDTTTISFTYPESINLNLKTLSTSFNKAAADAFVSEVANGGLVVTAKKDISASQEVEIPVEDTNSAVSFNLNHLPASIIENPSVDIDYTIKANSYVRNIVTTDKGATKTEAASDKPATKTDTKDEKNNQDTTKDTTTTGVKDDNVQTASHGSVTVTFLNKANAGAVGDILKKVTQLMYQVAETGSTIKMYYGANNIKDGLDTDSSTSLKEQSPQDSLYNALENNNLSGVIAELVSEDTADMFLEEATTVDKQIEDEKKTLQTQIEDTGFSDQKKDTLTAIDKQSENITKKGEELIKWYRSALKYTNAIKVPSMDPLVFDESAIPFAPADEPELSDDQETGPGLIDDYQNALTESQALSDQTMKDSAKIKSINKYFDDLKSSTDRLSNNSKSIVNSANGLSKNWKDTIADNGKFSSNFNTVLANTKKGNGNNQKVYNYLSNPVVVKNNGEISARSSIQQYYLVLINLFVTIFTSYFLSKLEKRREVKEADKFTNVNNILWKNLPWTFLILGTGIVEGTLIGIISRKILQTIQIPSLTWVLVAIFIQIALLSAMTYLLRQFGTIGMYIISIVTALYLFFTPSLGVKVTDGSWSKWFMMFSPLQYVENIYTRLAIGTGLGNKALLVLIVVALVFTALNLVTYKFKFKGIKIAAKTKVD